MVKAQSSPYFPRAHTTHSVDPESPRKIVMDPARQLGKPWLGRDHGHTCLQNTRCSLWGTRQHRRRPQWSVCRRYTPHTELQGHRQRRFLPPRMRCTMLLWCRRKSPHHSLCTLSPALDYCTFHERSRYTRSLQQVSAAQCHTLHTVCLSWCPDRLFLLHNPYTRPGLRDCTCLCHM